MKPRVGRCDELNEVFTGERCFIAENAGVEEDPGLSIARARVEPGVATARHVLTVDERYILVAGRGLVELGEAPGVAVGEGDVVIIPAGTAQRIINTGTDDLVFYCVCTPAFTPRSYRDLENDEARDESAPGS